MSETCVAAALAEIMVYNEATKKWQPPKGTDGQVSKVEIMQNNQKPAFRISSYREHDGHLLLNCNIHQKLKYHSATPTFHQWRDEHRQVYGLNFQSESDSRIFLSIIGQAIDHLSHQALNHQSDYQQPHQNDNVYQDPHQHMMHIQSAPSFDHHNSHHHDENQNANFRKMSQHASTLNNTLSQQQRRASQSSNASGGNSMFYNQHDHADSRQWAGNTSASSAPNPPMSNIPAAPPMQPVAPCSAPPPAPPLPPVNAGAPPPPPPPPPPNFMAGGGAGKPTSLADQLKMRSQQLNKTSNGGSGSSAKTAENDKPAPPVGTGNLMMELQAQINRRKMTQEKADAVDSKSNTSNGSSDSGCGTTTSVNGISNGGSIGSAGAKKWSVSEAKPTDSPKTHRKLPSASSLFASEDSNKTVNGVGNGNSNVISNELLERFRAELMVEVRLEINKAKQEIIEAIKTELSKR